jgi:hypothetical protein
MLAHLPRHLPAWPLMLADIGQPSAADVAAVLDVSRRTVERWNAAGQAPRVAALAIYRLTRWGCSEDPAGRRLQLAESLVLSLRADLIAERLRVAYLQGLQQDTGAAGSANGALWRQT